MQKTLYIPLDTILDDTVECEKLVKRGDTLKLQIKVFTNGVLADLTGQSIDLILKKADNTLIEYTIDSSDISNGVVTATPSQQSTLASGIVNGELQIYTDGTLASSNTFTFNVDASLADDVIEVSKNDIQVLAELKALIADGQVKINTYEENILAIGNTAEAIEALANVKLYIDTNLPSLQSENAKATVNIANETTANNTATQNISDLDARNNTASQNISNIDAKNSTASANISSLDAKNTTATQNINDLDARNNTASSNISSLDAKNSTASTNIANLDAENVRAEVNRQALADFGDATQLTLDVTALKNEIGTARGTGANLDERFNGIDTSLYDMANQQTTQNNNIATNTNSISAINTSLLNNVSNLNSLYKDILKIKIRQTGLNSDTNAWSDSLGDTTGINAGLSSGYNYTATKSLNTEFYSSDLCTTGQAIYDSSTQGSAFDDNITTYWQSGTAIASTSGVAYIGQNFGTTKTIKKVRVRQYGGSASISSAKLQYYNGSSWVDVQTLSLTVGSGTNPTDDTFLISGNYTGNQWRLLANANPTGGNKWAVYEIEMFELLYGTATIVWNTVTSTGTLTKAIVEAIQNLGTGTITYYISRDNGVTFSQCSLDTVTDISSQLSGSNIVLKAVITGNAELLAVAWGGEV